MPDSLDTAVKLVLQLLAIPGESGHEALVARFVTEQLRKAGVPASSIRSDRANLKAQISGPTSNLIVKLPGTVRRPRRLLMAHMDTVPLCVGCKPEIHNGFIRSADPNTALGADDRSGVAVILHTVMTILKNKLPHPPLTFLFTIQEETGLSGARHCDISMLGEPKLAFNWDGGAAERLTIGATGDCRLIIEVTGLASHAGIAPQKGVSAIAIAGMAIAELHEEGWHGDIVKGKKHGTSNVGFIEAGGPTNVVTNICRVRAEARSHDPVFRDRIMRRFESAFKKAAKKVRSSEGKHGEAKIERRHLYEAFKLPDDDPSILAAEAAIRSLGIEPVRYVSNGGLDASWMTPHGIPTVTLGAGQMNVHTTAERLDIESFEKACKIALKLATDVQ
jgi:tripeptide aminopeptidase